jgi:hypothetical protein
MTLRNCTMLAAICFLVTYTVANTLLIKDLTR